MPEKQPTCEERIDKELEERLTDLRKLWELEKEDPGASDEDLGTFNEYGLCFDYVSPNMFKGQRRGYFRYQLSWGGPSDEFRFECDENLRPTRISYWFLDWFDGAHRNLKGDDLNLLEKIFEYFHECGTVDSLLEAARKEGFEPEDDDDEEEKEDS
jgi:hypothetical protein